MLGDPSDSYLAEVGRVVYKVVILEYQLASIVAQLRGADDGHVMSLMGKPGLLKEYGRSTKGVVHADLRAELERLGVDFEELRDRRHEVVHSIVLSEFPGGVEIQHFAHDPKTDLSKRLPTPETLADIARRAGAMGARALTIQHRVADYVRTSESG